MQTFLPYPHFRKSLECLDTKRLGKQRVEAMQLLQALERGSGAWYNHPATKMWKGYEEALTKYHNRCIEIWIERGYKNTMQLRTEAGGVIPYPTWFGDDAFHASHRSNLLRKNPEWYSQFGWNEPNNLEYVWPV